MANAGEVWLYEAGIGENRAALVADGKIVKARIERENSGVQTGEIADARFTSQWVKGRSGIAVLDNGEEVLLQPLPKGLTEGALVRLEIVRAAHLEKGGIAKRAKAKPAHPSTQPCSAPSLLSRIKASAIPVRTVHPHEADILGEYGWHEIMDEAATGRIAFSGGSLLISSTPAMTVIDVDGPLDAFTLASRAAQAIAEILVKLDIGGSIGVDFPTLEAKAQRTAVCDIFDTAMYGDCERTAINGFGFMQIIRRKRRASVLEIIQTNSALSEALNLLRQAERESGTGEIVLTPSSSVAAELKSEWLDILARQTGRRAKVEYT